uniref:Uncharacterized protein n=1 Tax=Setaria digitata TaxID=48799 RepID=A0A915PUK6_9BILA
MKSKVIFVVPLKQTQSTSASLINLRSSCENLTLGITWIRLEADFALTDSARMRGDSQVGQKFKRQIRSETSRRLTLSTDGIDRSASMSSVRDDRRQVPSAQRSIRLTGRTVAWGKHAGCLGRPIGPSPMTGSTEKGIKRAGGRNFRED